MLYIYIQYTVYVVGTLAAIKSKVLIVSFQQEESDFCLFILCLVILLISETQTFSKKAQLDLPSARIFFFTFFFA